MATALSICCEVTALTLDAIYERPMSSLGSGVIRRDKDRDREKDRERDKDEGDDDENNNHHSTSDDPPTTTSSSSSSAFFVPSALAVLRQCGGQEALLHAFPLALVENNVLATDQEALLVLDYLQSHLTQATSHSHSHTSTSTSTSMNNTSRSTSASSSANNAGVTSNGTLTSAQHTLSMVGGTERDAVELTLALWHRDAVGDARNEVANVVLDCMSHLTTTSTTSQHHTLTDTTASSSSSVSVSGSGRGNDRGNGSTGSTALSMAIVTSPLAFRANRPLFPSSSSSSLLLKSSSSMIGQGQGVFMKTAARGNNRACFSYEWLTYCYRTMLTKRCLETDFEKIVHAILYLFSGPFYRNYLPSSNTLSTPFPFTLHACHLLACVFLSSSRPLLFPHVFPFSYSSSSFQSLSLRFVPVSSRPSHLSPKQTLPSSYETLFETPSPSGSTTLPSVSERKQSSWWVALC